MTANTPFVVSEFLKSAVCTLYLAGAQASGANIDVAGRTLHDRLDALDIGLPCTVGTTVRVRDLDTKCDALAADFAFCHSWHLLYRLVNKIHFTRKRKKNQVFFSDFRIFIKFHKNHGSKGRFLRIVIFCRQCRQPVGRADSRYAKGTVALTAPINRIYAAVRGFCPVTEIKRIGSIARALRIPIAKAATKAC